MWKAQLLWNYLPTVRDGQRVRNLQQERGIRLNPISFFVAPQKVKKHIFLSEYLADDCWNLKPRENTFEIKKIKNKIKEKINSRLNRGLNLLRHEFLLLGVLVLP